jgi:hypothetical protein
MNNCDTNQSFVSILLGRLILFFLSVHQAAKVLVAGMSGDDGASSQ